MEYLPEQCAEVRAALPLYVGCDLDSEEMEVVGAHLVGCSLCSDLHQRAREARDVLVGHVRRVAAGPVPPLWEGVRAGLLAEGRMESGPRPIERTNPRRGLSTPLRRLWVGSAAAAAALVFSLGLAHLSRSTAPDSVLPGAGSGAVLRTNVTSGTVGGEALAASPIPDAGQAGALRHVGARGEPMFLRGVEVRAEQGLVFSPLDGRSPSDLAGAELVGAPKRPLPRDDRR